MDTVGMVILAISALALLESLRRTSGAKSARPRVSTGSPPSAADPPSTPRGVSDRRRRRPTGADDP